MAKITLYDQTNHPVIIDDTKELSRGGEGKIIQVGKDYVAKIYLPGISPITEQRFKALNSLQPDEFVKPLKLLMDDKGKIKGYMMKLIPHDFFPLYSIYNQNFCDRLRINDDFKKHIIEEMIKQIEYVHKQNIVIGDLNPFNILLNDKGQYYFIDVDSYEAGGAAHSGRLLEEVRDYLYNGNINIKSDYFALSIIAFNMLTTVHPFKGIHKKYNGIMERMIHKVPIFDKDPNLIVPKCYKSIQNQQLQDQFIRIFKNGERFLINLANYVSTGIVTPIKPILKTIKDLMINEVIIGADIDYIIANDKLMLVVCFDQVYLFDMAIKGYSQTLAKFAREKYDEYFITETSVFILRNNELYDCRYLLSNTTKLKGFIVNEPILFTQQYDNILTIITESSLYIVYLNRIVNNYIKFEVKNVYGLGFKKGHGLIQQVDGKTYLRYNYKDTLNTVQFPKYLNDVYQIKDIGIAQYIENKQIKYCIFKIEGLNIRILSTPIDEFKSIGYKDNTFISYPEDNKLKLLRVIDGQPLVEFDCDIIDDMTQTFITNAGIIIRTGKEVYLLNKK